MIGHVGTVAHNEANPTTGLTFTVPAGVEAGDDLYAWLADQGTGAETTPPSITDDQSASWTSKGTQNTGGTQEGAGTLYHRKATSGTAGITVTVTGFHGSCSGLLACWEGADTDESVTQEGNPSTFPTHAGLAAVTPSRDDSVILLFIADLQNDILNHAAYAATDPASLTERGEASSTAGADCSVHIASGAQTTAAAVGNITWTQTNAANVTIALVLLPPAGQTVAAGLANETDSTFAVGKAKLRSVGLTAESDAAFAAPALRAKAVGLGGESDSAFGVTIAVGGALGLAAETDSALATTPAKRRDVGLAAETDSAFATAALRTKAVGFAGESDAALPAQALRTKPVGFAGESDTAHPTPALRTKPVGFGGEAAAALTVVSAKLKAVGLATETDLSFAASIAKAVSAGQPIETNIAFVIGRQKTFAAGLAIETDFAFAVVQGEPPLLAGVIFAATVGGAQRPTTEPRIWTAAVSGTSIARTEDRTYKAAVGPVLNVPPTGD